MEQIQQRLEKLKQKQKGFTLVELIVVIAIIGILAGVMLPKYFEFTNDARKGAAISEAKSIRTIAETFYAKNGSWPAASGAGPGFTVGTDTTNFTGSIAVNTGTVALDDGSFKYTKDTFTAECDAGGTITSP